MRLWIKIKRLLNRFVDTVHCNPMRFSFGLMLFLVGASRTTLLPMPTLDAWDQPEFLYAEVQCLAGLALLLTTNRRWTYWGRVASVVAVTVCAMLGWSLWQQLYATDAMFYVVMAGMLLLLEVPARVEC